MKTDMEWTGVIVTSMGRLFINDEVESLAEFKKNGSPKI